MVSVNDHINLKMFKMTVSIPVMSFFVKARLHLSFTPGSESSLKNSTKNNKCNLFLLFLLLINSNKFLASQGFCIFLLSSHLSGSFMFGTFKGGWSEINFKHKPQHLLLCKMKLTFHWDLQRLLIWSAGVRAIFLFNQSLSRLLNIRSVAVFLVTKREQSQSITPPNVPHLWRDRTTSPGKYKP